MWPHRPQQNRLQRRSTQHPQSLQTSLAPRAASTSEFMQARKLYMERATAPTLAATKRNPDRGTQAVKLSFSSLSLSSSSHISSSDSVFFFLPSFSFFSMSLIAFFLSLSLIAWLFFTSILLPAAS